MANANLNQLSGDFTAARKKFSWLVRDSKTLGFESLLPDPTPRDSWIPAR
jgi:hypothetical protein